LPHPSGANAERIAYFLGNKDRKALSEKTDPLKLDRAKTELLSRIHRLIDGHDGRNESLAPSPA
jgi:hypothetical protein